MLRCEAGHAVEKVKKLKSWQGHVHLRECVFCHNEIDRHEVHYSCPEKCRYEVCQFCYKSEVAKRKARAAAAVEARNTSVDRPSPASAASGKQITSQESSASGRSRLTPNGQEPRRGGRLRQASERLHSVSQEFMVSPWQHAVETCFWVVTALAGDYFGALYIQHLTSDKELDFPQPYVTACLSNLVASGILFVVLEVLNKVGLPDALGELTANVEVEWKMPAMLGVLSTLQIGLLVKVISNEHHTMAAWIFMLSPVLTVFLASSPFLRMETQKKELFIAAVVASLGGILAVRGPLPSIEGLGPLGFACVALVLTSATFLVTQRVMQPAAGPRPAALVVAKSMLVAGAGVGTELSLVYEWHGFTSLPWHPNLSTVLFMACIIGTCCAASVVARTRLIQVTSATFASLLVPFHTVTMLPVEELSGSISIFNWLGLMLSVAGAVLFFQARKDGVESGYLPMPGGN